MPKNFCDITVILDRSGSMESIRGATVEGLNRFVEDQKSVPGDGCWTLIQFDDPACAKSAKEDFPQVVFEAAPQGRVPRLTEEAFRPRGGTALVDAVCLTIDRIGRRLKSLPESERPDKVLVVIVTDGEENSSKEFRKSHLNERIARQRSEYNWQFIFLGANQDAIAEAQSYGIAAKSALTYTADDHGTQTAYRSASVGTRNWKADGNPTAAPLLGSAAPDVNVNVNVNTGGQP